MVVLDLIESGTEAYHLIRSPCPVVDRGYFCLDTDSALFQKKITSVKSDDALLIFSLSFAFACGELDFLFPCAYGGG